MNDLGRTRAPRRRFGWIIVALFTALIGTLLGVWFGTCLALGGWR